MSQSISRRSFLKCAGSGAVSLAAALLTGVSAAAAELRAAGDPALLDGFTQERDGLLTVPAEKRKPCLAHLMTQAAQGNAAAHLSIG